MATSGSSNFVETRDSIITRALRIVGGLGQGETASTVETTEAAQALNDIVKALQADGMQLWHRATINFTPTAGVTFYSFGIGGVINQTAPLKVYDALYRNTTTNMDTPMIVVTQQEYFKFSNKLTQGTPNIVFYDPPNSTTGEMQGTIYLFVTPDATFAAANKIYLTAQFPIQDFDASTDNPDFPSYWYNCLVWMLADDLSYEYKVPLSERAMISKKAEDNHLRALGFDMEEGSIYFQPDTRFTE